MIDSAIRVDFEVLLGFEDAIADFAETLVVDQQVSLLEVVGISLLVEHLYVGHVGTNPLVLLHSQQVVEHILEVLQQVILVTNDLPVVRNQLKDLVRVQHTCLRVLLKQFKSLVLELNGKLLAFLASFLLVVVQVLALLHHIKFVLVDVDLQEGVHEAKLGTCITKLLCFLEIFTLDEDLNGWLVLLFLDEKDNFFFHHP